MKGYWLTGGFGWLTGWLDGWLVGWLAGYIVGSLAGWLAYWADSSSIMFERLYRHSPKAQIEIVREKDPRACGRDMDAEGAEWVRWMRGRDGLFYGNFKVRTCCTRVNCRVIMIRHIFLPPPTPTHPLLSRLKHGIRCCFCHCHCCMHIP